VNLRRPLLIAILTAAHPIMFAIHISNVNYKIPQVWFD